MKKLITILFITLGLVAHAQTTINPDTVCINAIGEQYFVTNTPTSTTNGRLQVVVEHYKPDKEQTLLQQTGVEFQVYI